MNTEPTSQSGMVDERLARYPLLDALLHRRSRRFAKGMRLNGGPLAYQSAHAPQPLSIEEEAALAFAACGVTGSALAELPYESGDVPEAGGGNIMVRFVGRTVASPDAVQTVTLCVINDDGAWLLKRPQDYTPAEIGEIVEAARAGRLVEVYEKARVRLTDHRVDVPRHLPFVPPFNKWSANVAGSTYFVPINEVTELFINILLSVFTAEFGYFIVDERNHLQPAGIARFARSKGGHLDDDPAEGRFATIEFFESYVHELSALEQGMMAQNLGLMAQALGLGGFPHFAAHPYGWFEALGFRMQDLPVSRTIHAGIVMKGLLKALHEDIPVPAAVGLERDGQVLLKPYCPPYYPTMRDAVLALVEQKYAAGTGVFRDGGAVAGWRDGAAVQAGIPPYPVEAVEATIACCEYIWDRYGRFPPYEGPLRSLLAYQAHHVDSDFYDRFYKPDALTETQREHDARYHAR
ncbi:MAG: hypothetical protein U0641_14310 [Anaerolineae bacterium]